jgi:NADH dehydrogenase
MSGFLAWFMWLTVHIFFLIGFRNRISVFVAWIWTYFTFTRGARLITGDQRLPGWPDDTARTASESQPRAVANSEK